MQQSDAHSTWQIVIDHVSLILDLHFIFAIHREIHLRF